MKRRYDLVIFDCDGVLLDSEIIACSADADAFTRIGHPLTTEEVAHRFAGMPYEAMYAELEAEMGRPLPAGFAADVTQLIIDKYRTELQAIDGAAEVLRELSIPKCVASSSAPSKLALGLIEMNLYDLVYPHIFSTSLVARGKPHPDIFEYAARQMRTPPERCIVVEDSVAGATAAQSAGMACVGFTGGSHCPPGHDERLRDAGTVAVISDIRDLLSHLA